MFTGGYLQKLLRIDLSNLNSRVERIRDEDIVHFLGGRGLGALCYARELSPNVEPLAAGNKLFFFTGPMTGAPLPSTTKLSLATRSPETGQYLCTNSGGDFGPQLKRAGFDAIIVEGQASSPVFVRIVDDEVTFHSAVPFLGLSSNKVRASLLEAAKVERGAVLSSGPAAERGVAFSNILVDSGRAFGRGGSGAVMASKNLKGIVVGGTGIIPLADPDRVRAINRAAVEDLRTSRAGHTRYGTPYLTEVINTLGCYPAHNFQSSYLAGAEVTYAQALRDKYWARNTACFHCPVACGKFCEVREGPYCGAQGRLEYETIGMFGGSCGLKDLGAIIACSERCDEYGIDTISTGNAVALLMELSERGLLQPEDTAGTQVRFGDGDAALRVVHWIGEREHIGALLGEGMRAVLTARPEWSQYILAVKGLPVAAYDPRGFYGMGLAYGTSSRGACHNVGGWTIRDELQSGKYDRFALHGKGELVKALQDTRGYLDSVGMCTIPRHPMGFANQPSGDVLLAVTGHDFTPELVRIGERVYTLERTILNREGVRRADDYLPRRFMEEPVPDGPAKGHVLTREMYDVMLNEYYGLRGWDKDGVPTPERLRALSLDALR